MGAVMSYAMALGADRPVVAGILAFSGFIPVVDGWDPTFADRQALGAFIAHGSRDPVISVDFGRRARELLEEGGVEVDYRESDVGHQIDPTQLPAASEWLADKIPAG
jgi:phospholipase/carboxylesterase